MLWGWMRRNIELVQKVEDKKRYSEHDVVRVGWRNERSGEAMKNEAKRLRLQVLEEE